MVHRQQRLPSYKKLVQKNTPIKQIGVFYSKINILAINYLVSKANR
jgi:hypothetical protein